MVNSCWMWEEQSSHNNIRRKGEHMDYLVMKALFQLMIDKSHREFIKAIISIETDVEDEDRLNRLYDFYMEDDDMSLLNYALVE